MSQAMSPSLGVHPGMTPHFQQLQAHLLRNAAVASLIPPHPLQSPCQPAAPQSQAHRPHGHSHTHSHPHAHVHSHGHSHNLSQHSQLFPVSPHSTGTNAISNHAGGVPTKNEVSYLHLTALNIFSSRSFTVSYGR